MGFTYWLRYCSDIAHRKPTKLLYISWAATLYTFPGDLAPNGVLPGTKFTLCPSLAFACIGNVTARHSSRGHHQTLQRGTRNGITELSQRAPPIFGRAAITLGISPHSSASLLFESILQCIPRATASRLVLHKSNHKLVSYWCCHAADISHTVFYFQILATSYTWLMQGSNMKQLFKMCLHKSR